MQATQVIETAGHQRMRGHARVCLEKRRGATRLADLAQSGAAKAMLPRIHGANPEIVLLNTAGGLTGGDRLRYELRLGAHARAAATTQTAERAYRSLPGATPARLDVEIALGPGASLAWLPQETILYDGAALHRRTVVSLAPGARCLSCESIVLGRTAMGETVQTLAFRDRREFWRDGVPVLIDPFQLGAEALGRRAGNAMMGGARAMGSVVLLAADAEERLASVRSLLDSAGVEAAASAWDGRLVLRALANDGRPLRTLLAAVLERLGGVLPRVWQI